MKDGKEKENWTGDYIFDVAVKGKYKIAVKVVDIFGNDTTKVMEVKI